MRTSGPVLLLLLASCDTGGIAVTVPRVEGPDAAFFDDIVFGKVGAATVQVRNVGTGEAWIALSADEPFRVAGAELRLAGGAAVDVTVTFRPVSYDDVAGALEISSGDERLLVPLYATVERDADQDGALARGAGGDDCDDSDPSVRPGLDEVCDGRDNDCNGKIDDDAVDQTTWYFDGDGDGYGGPVTRTSCERPSGYTALPGDCDDTDPTIYPGAHDPPHDQIDQDCDGWP